MFKTKVTDILRTLSKEELKMFGDYLSSPLFNKRKIICDLFDTYKKYYPDFSDKNFTKEKIHSKIFKGQKFNEKNLRNLNSILVGFAEDFLSYLSFKGNKFEVKRHLLDEINRRNILTIFGKNFDESKEIVNQMDKKDLDYFLNLHKLFLQKDLYNSFINKFSMAEIIESEKNLLIYFIMQQLEIQNYILYNCRVRGIEKSLLLPDSVIDSFLKKITPEITQIPQIQILYNSLKLEQTNEEKYYSELKRLLSRFGHLINKEKHYNKYLEMMDYVKRTRSSRDNSRNEELFHFRKEMVEKGLIMENTIASMFFLNIVKSGTRCGEFDWVFNFINQYQEYIIPKYRDTTVELSLALFYFEKKQMNEALSHAAKVRYEDIFYNLEVKNLTSKIYYETGEHDLLINFNSSYRMYLSKNRSLKKKDYESHQRFLNYFNKLIRISLQEKYYKLNILLNEIRNKEFVSNLWLEEKIKELKALDARKAKRAK